jgi:dipeptidase
MNEHGVGFGESTTYFKLYSWLPDTTNKVHVHDAMRIALERCKTARCAIQTMGDVSVQYGFYGVGPLTGESISVIDTKEAWIWQVGNGLNNKSAVWAAQRVPDDHVAVAHRLPPIATVAVND